MPPPGTAACVCASGICQMTASVVSNSEAIDVAFCRAEWSTLVGSINSSKGSHGEDACADHGRPVFDGLLTEWSSSATVNGAAPRHTNNMTAGGTRQAPTHSSPMFRVTAAPAATLHAIITITTANHAPINRTRETPVNMVTVPFRL